MKTKRINIISLASVVLLIIAMTLGVSLMSDATAYTNNEINIVQSNVTNNNITIDTSTMTKTDEYVGVEGAVPINSADELKAFLNGTNNAAYGYLTASFAYENNVGTQYEGVENTTFASGRTLDGNGHTITLTTKCVSPFINVFGMFVDTNYGTIKNINFVYNASTSMTNNAAWHDPNYVGVVSGINYGTIQNCDLTISGSINYSYSQGNNSNSNITDRNQRFATYFGGFAGGNNSVITNVGVYYNNANINVWTTAHIQSNKITDARSIFGGVAAISTNANAYIKNVIAVANGSTFTIEAQRYNDGYVWEDESNAYYMAAAVLGANSAYTSGTPTVVDNVIVYWNATYVKKMYSGQNDLGTTSNNAVVSGGPNTNVTVLDDNYNTDHCNCVSGSGQHSTSLANRFVLDGNVNITIAMQGNKQIITATPKEGYVLGTAKFEKFKNGEEDKSSKGGPQAGTSTLFSSATTRESYTLEVPAYQPSTINGNETGNDYYWTYSVDAYQLASLVLDSAEVTYTGEDFAKTVFAYQIGDVKTPITDATLKLLQDGNTMTSLIMPGEYSFNLGALTGDVAYYNTTSKVVVLADDTTYNLTIKKGDVTPLTGIDGWSNQKELVFALLNSSVEGAVNGYEYTVNGSVVKKVNSLTMVNTFDTSAEGRDYVIRLTKDGVVVTNDYTFNIKVDNTAPEISNVVFDKDNSRYNTSNAISFEIDEPSSGLATLTLNGLDLLANAKSETYYAQLNAGTNTIVAIDNAGNSKQFVIDAKIDSLAPSLTLSSYYYYDNNGELTKINYTGTEVNSAVYIQATTSFGVAGGNVYYSINDGEYQLYEDVIKVMESANVKIYAQSNTYGEDGVALATEVQSIDVKVNINKVTITNSDLTINNAQKDFDGTNTFYGTIDFVDAQLKEQYGLSVSVSYADVNAGQEVALVVEIRSSNDDVIIDNQVDLYGVINKKSITIAIDNASRFYLQTNPVFSYTTNQVQGYEENIILVTDALHNSEVGANYRIYVQEGQEFKNYTIGEVTEGVLTINAVEIDRLIYDYSTISGLDTINVVGRDVVVKFKDANGVEVNLLLSYEYSATIDGEYVACEKMTSAGYYRVTLSLPEEYAEFYTLKDNVKTLTVKVVDAGIFETPEEEPSEEVPSEPQEGEDAGVYENNSQTSSTMAQIKAHFDNHSNEYIAVIAILIVIASIVCVVLTKKLAGKKN